MLTQQQEPSLYAKPQVTRSHCSASERPHLNADKTPSAHHGESALQRELETVAVLSEN